MAAGRRKRRDSALIDALESFDPVAYSSPVWRIVREGRSPVQCSRSGGRWDDGTFDVLYTSEARAGAIEEMRFHLLRGQPVMPSQVSYRLYEIGLTIDRTLKFANLEALAKIGLDTSRYGQLSYEEKDAEYPRSQDIGESAHFLEYDGLIAPSARHDSLNVIVFCDRLAPGALTVNIDHGPVDWRS